MIGAKQGGSIFHCRQPRASTAFAVAGRPLPLPKPSKGAILASNLAGIGRMPVEHLMQSTIFATPNLMVRYVGGFSTDKLVITFYHYANARSTNVSGFGEEFFLRRNIDAVHFIPAQNNWYQYDELPHAAALVRKIAEQYRKVVTYGSSMGGYAAIRFGRAVGASEALALSPQFSIDPLVTPFEQRWAPHSARISFALERSWREQFVPRAYVVYDPYDRDRRHVEMFRGETAVIDIRVLNGGHPTIWLLADLGLLEAIIFDVLHDQLDPKAIQQSVRAARGRAPRFYFLLAQKSHPNRRRLRLAQRAHEMAPGNSSFQMGYALALAGVGRQEDAMRVGRRLGDCPIGAHVLYLATFLYEWLREFEAAAEIMHRLIELDPSAAADHEARRFYLDQRASVAVNWRAEIRDRAAIARPNHLDDSLPRPIHRSIPKSDFFSRLPFGVGRPIARAIRHHAERRLPRPVVPVPPPLPCSITGHPALPRRFPDRIVDLVLVGDETIEQWPEALWPPLTIFKMGSAGDRTQHTLWRLRQVAEHLNTRFGVVMLGGGNLADGDDPAEVAAGIHAVVRKTEFVARAPTAAMLLPRLVGVPPELDRRRAKLNDLLRSEP